MAGEKASCAFSMEELPAHLIGEVLTSGRLAAGDLALVEHAASRLCAARMAFAAMGARDARGALAEVRRQLEEGAHVSSIRRAVLRHHLDLLWQSEDSSFTFQTWILRGTSLKQEHLKTKTSTLIYSKKWRSLRLPSRRSTSTVEDRRRSGSQLDCLWRIDGIYAGVYLVPLLFIYLC